MRVAVTGANGFVGRGVLYALGQAGFRPVAIVRRHPQVALPAAEVRVVSDPWSPVAWSSVAAGAGALVHLIGHAHHPLSEGTEAACALQHVNVGITQAVLRGLTHGGPRRVVYMSSVKAITERTSSSPVTASTIPSPTTAYGESKLRAEDLVSRWSEDEHGDSVILRPPIVYGPGVKGNMRQLIRLADTPMPLPLGGIHNARSLISLDNLVDAVVAAVQVSNPGAIRLPLADPAPLSTTELVRRLREHLNRPSRLLPIPGSWLEGVARILGMSERVSKLTQDLVIANAGVQAALGWVPRQPTGEGLAAMVESYLATDGWTRPAQ